MKKYHFIINLVLAIALILYGGCSKNSSVDPVESTSIFVKVTDENGDPIEGAAVKTNPETDTITTDDEGKVLFQNLPVRSYSVIVNYSGSPEFKQFVNLSTSTTADLHFIILSQLSIHIKDEQLRPISDATLSTIPLTQEVIADNDGVAILKNVPVQAYLFTVTPQNLPPVKRNIVLDENTRDSMDFMITSQAPVVQIIEPVDDKVTTPFEVAFEGLGTDNEDGDLPDSAYKWFSNSDGELGTGKRIIIDELSRGSHIITLTCTDSDNKSTTTTISIIIVNYDPNSYFPLLENANWEYRHANPNFYIIANNVSEYWEVKDMIIAINDQLQRISSVYYDITIGVVVKHYKYTLIDYLEEENNTIYVTKTSEEMIEWQGNEEKNPYFRLNIDTSYTPSFLILKNITDPFSEPQYDHTVRTESEWKYTYFSTTSSIFRESLNLETTVTVGETRYIQTDKGHFPAVKISISSSADDIKTWWLTQGLGIVQIDYMLSGSVQTATLTDSDLLEFYRTPEQKMISGKATEHSSPVVFKKLNYSNETGEGLMELRNLLRNMIPY
ncbi:MAG: carboxypeptidase regulatory-like domain-containing protein [Candidatus Latescibacteria bacterium]|nr:carboxypeptidase regulatory-like domain-containing protein [Candidatus Latescibacterota bacterium]